MKTVELSAALGQAQVVENLKNFVGVDAQGAAALMTPERLAAVAGGLNIISDTFVPYKTLVYIGDLKTAGSKTYEFITFHPDGVQEIYSIVTIGRLSQGEKDVCSAHNIYGYATLYRLSGTDKVYLLVPTYRYLGYRLLFGTDISHEVVQDFKPETMTQYERLSPTIV